LTPNFDNHKGNQQGGHSKSKLSQRSSSHFQLKNLINFL
jgi:hypothetical protein